MTDNNLNHEENEIALALGRCLLSWSNVEMYLCLLFEEILEAPPGRAFMIFDSVISFEAKLKTVDTVFTYIIQDETLLAVWGKLFKRISKKSRLRSEIAHASTGNENGGKIVLVPYYSFIKLRKGLSPADINQRKASFEELIQAIRWLHLQVRLQKNKLVTVKLQTPDLIRRWLDQIDQTDAENKQPAPPSTGES